MREIKFRAWHLGEKVMTPWHQMIDDHWDLTELNRRNVMQYTGLKDKNGKEIYEGDMLAEINDISELQKWGKPVVVEYGVFEGHTDSWGVKFGMVGFHCRYENGARNALHDIQDCYGFEASEVMIVGNIYENPELL